MDNTELIKWVISVGAGSVAALFLSILGIIKFWQMSKRDLKKSDLENEKLALEKKEKEVSLAEQLNNLATNAALKAVDWQTKFDNLERSHKSLVQKVDEQAITIKSQSAIIKKQEETIRIQSAQIGLMVEKARQQDEIIATLTLELEKYKPKEC